MKKKLSKAQERTWNEISTAAWNMPNTAYTTFRCQLDYTSEKIEKIWFKDRVYGTFNTATLRALESAGLIRVHVVGGASCDDEIEIIEIIENK